MTRDEQLAEVAKCYRSAAYFITHYCHIYDATLGDWIPFALWPEQRRTLDVVINNLLVVILKARQLGLTWLVLAYALWLTLFRPAATVLLFSRRDDEAMYLLGDERLGGMARRLPEWMRPRATEDSRHVWALANGSVVRAFPTGVGDSYTATLAIVDEADLVPDLGRLMRAVKPTVDGGGRMILLSRANKSEPESEFKNIYRAAKRGENGWAPVFLSWHARPGRDAAWYDAQRRDILSRTGALDDLHEQYPASDAEALAPATLDKRIAPQWLLQCYEERAPLAHVEGAPAIPGLEIYARPQPSRRYVMGVDPAEGNPTSDPSALTVLDALSGEEVAALAGRIEPAIIAAHADRIGRWYNRAACMVERNNHGHSVLLWLRDHSSLPRLVGWDGKEGWLSTSRGKTLLYDAAADAFRDREVVLHSFATFTQLSSIEGATLKAPEGQHDDRADSCALCLGALSLRRRVRHLNPPQAIVRIG
jgi:hypothetical protein